MPPTLGAFNADLGILSRPTPQRQPHAVNRDWARRSARVGGGGAGAGRGTRSSPYKPAVPDCLMGALGEKPQGRRASLALPLLRRPALTTPTPPAAAARLDE